MSVQVVSCLSQSEASVTTYSSSLIPFQNDPDGTLHTTNGSLFNTNHQSKLSSIYWTPLRGCVTCVWSGSRFEMTVVQFLSSYHERRCCSKQIVSSAEPASCPSHFGSKAIRHGERQDERLFETGKTLVCGAAIRESTCFAFFDTDSAMPWDRFAENDPDESTLRDQLQRSMPQSAWFHHVKIATR